PLHPRLHWAVVCGLLAANGGDWAKMVWDEQAREGLRLLGLSEIPAPLTLSDAALRVLAWTCGQHLFLSAEHRDALDWLLPSLRAIGSRSPDTAAEMVLSFIVHAAFQRDQRPAPDRLLLSLAVAVLAEPSSHAHPWRSLARTTVNLICAHLDV